jgi:hypothetical protein
MREVAILPDVLYQLENILHCNMESALLDFISGKIIKICALFNPISGFKFS